MSGRVYVRKFDWDEARRLRAEGLTLQAIAERFGVSPTAITFAVVPGAYAAARGRRAEYQRNGGNCVDCGTRLSHNYSRPVRRCKPCASLAQATTATDTELRCYSCHEWKPDNDYPYSRSAYRNRRGRHGTCRACHTLRRQAYRERHKVPCVGCGKPALPPNEKTSGGGSQPRCRDCFHEWQAEFQRQPEQREAARQRALAQHKQRVA